MTRQLLFVALSAAALLGFEAEAATYSKLVPQTAAARHGLVRSWFGQAQVDRSRGRLKYLVLQDGVLYCQTDRATIHAMDAETGQTLWVKRVGDPNHPSMKPAANKDLLALVNGSRLYIMNRYNGDLLHETEVNGAPGAGAALSDKRAYVPMVNGMMMAYRVESLTDPQKELGFGKAPEDLSDDEISLAEEDRRENLRLSQEIIRPLACRSKGRILVPPLVTMQNEGEEFCVWPTDEGYLNIGRVDLGEEKELEIKSRLETNAPVVAQPTYRPADPDVLGDQGVILATTRDGFVHAIAEKGGDTLWRFSTGEPILQPAAVVGDRIYVVTRIGSMYCVDAQNGRELWYIAGVGQFLAASKTRVYVTDRSGDIVILDAKTGGRIGSLPADSMSIKLINLKNDRIYLANETGLIQCLHEIGQAEPLDHVAWAKQLRDAKPEEDKIGDGAGEQPPVGGQDPLGGGNDDPLGGGGEDPFGGAGGGGAGDGGAGDGGAGDGGAGDGGAGGADDPFGVPAGDDPFS